MATAQGNRPGGYQGGQQRQHTDAAPVQKPGNIDRKILETGIKESHIDNLKKWGEYLAANNGGVKVTTSQLRRFFGEIKRIQADFDNCKTDLILLDPKIAYAVGRAKKDARRNENIKIEDLYHQLAPLISEIREDQPRFRRFVQVCEAIVAYHKQFGGDN